MTNKSVAQICAIAAVVIMPSLSWAGTTSKTVAPKTTAPAPEKLNESFITGDLGLNVVSAYYFHGVLQNNHKPSLQPYADIFLKAYEGDGALNKVVFGLGVWESYTDAGTVGANGLTYKKHSPNNSAWFEHDVTPSVAFSFGKVTITETYQFFSSPNNQFDDSQALNSKLSFDDADLLGAFALHPSVSLTHEIQGKQANSTSPKHGNYWEASVAPSYSAGPVTVTVPLVMGFGTQSYYLKNGYAFTSVGVNLAYTLPVSKSYGTWTANAGATYYTLDNNVVSNGRNNANRDVVAQGGLGVAF